ncbi:MAG: FAD-binding oxidoreductase [Ramlibacter sp.]|nr:FAD-binding oxidoreductase [Ramlibacter sp.]
MTRMTFTASMIEDRYLHDWTGTRYGVPAGLERPASTQDLVRVVRDCARRAGSLAIQGGRTGVSGGAAPGDRETVLSLERLDRVVDFDTRAGVIIVGAGMILQDLQRAVEVEGWSFPLDLASRGSCQIGGNIATNAGGSRVIKYGNVRESVLGLEAVLADGSVLGPPNRLIKNNAGYSLASLLVGSEGTLGVITRAALRLVPLPQVRRTALLALEPATPLADLVHRCRRTLRESLSAFEVMWPDFVTEAMGRDPTARHLPESFSGVRVALLEVEGDDDAMLGRTLEHCLLAMVETGLLRDVVLSVSSRDARDLWAIREAVGDLQATIRPYVGFDLGMATAGHDAFVAKARERLSRCDPPVRSFFFGHAGDGNLHAIVGPCCTPESRHAVEEALYRLLEPLTTSVTAEHGIGRKKKQYLAHSRSADDIRAMKTLKAALDPHGVLNPGRIFDLDH